MAKGIRVDDYGNYYEAEEEDPAGAYADSLREGGGERAETQNLGHENSEGSGGDTPAGPTQAQIDAAERGTNFEGRSFGPEQEQGFINDALSKGVPQSWIDSFLARNPHDSNRLHEQWLDEQSPNGAEQRNAGTSGSGSGSGGNKPAFAPPDNSPGWMPTLDLPTWQAPAPFDPGPAFAGTGAFDPGPAFAGIGNFEYPEYVKPADYVAGTFEHNAYVKPDDYVQGEFKAPTIEEAREEPGFKFALDEGRRQMEASSAAKGIGRTGGTVKRLIGYGQDMADTNYGNVYNRNKMTFDTNENNRAEAYKTNTNLGLEGWKANESQRLGGFIANENAGLGAYQTNTNLGLSGWKANQANAKDTFDTGYTTAKDIYDTGYTQRKDVFDTGYTTAKDVFDTGYTQRKDKWRNDFDASSFGHTARTNELIGEFAPKQAEATAIHAQDFAAWLAKMGIAGDIFKEGSD